MPWILSVVILLTASTMTMAAEEKKDAFDAIVEGMDTYSLLGIRLGEKIDDVAKRMPGILAKVMDDNAGLEIYNIKGNEGSAVYANGDHTVAMVLHSLGRITIQEYKHVVVGMRAVGGVALEYRDDPGHMTWVDVKRMQKIDIKLTPSGECVLILSAHKN